MRTTKTGSSAFGRELLPGIEATHKHATSNTVYNIVSLLGTGEKNRMTSAELCNILNCDRRTLQKLVNADRKNGAMIISGSDGIGGYWLAEDQEQYDNFCKWLFTKQIGSAAFFRKQIKNETPGQTSVFEREVDQDECC